MALNGSKKKTIFIYWKSRFKLFRKENINNDILFQDVYFVLKTCNSILQKKKTIVKLSQLRRWWPFMVYTLMFYSHSYTQYTSIYANVIWKDQFFYKLIIEKFMCSVIFFLICCKIFTLSKYSNLHIISVTFVLY